MADADPIQRLNAALDGRYRMERELGAGGMATVYLAEDVRHHRSVALKVLKPELAAVVGSERFLAEIETTANLQHPHILPLFDSGEADGFLFYVMPYVEGESLRERLAREHQLPVDDAVEIASDVASALDYAHGHGVIHRDIKPANILLSETGEPLVSDFGISLAVSAGGGDRLTETGLSLGTPHYMSPEQATGDLNVGPQADIWALGCVLYEMLVGEPPFTGSTPQAVLGRLITGDPPSARDERSSVPRNVEATIAKALEKIPADRFAEATEFVRAMSDRGFRHGRDGDSVGSGRRQGLLAGAVAVAALSLSALVWVVLARPAVAPSVARLQSPFFSDQLPDGPMQLSADGRALFYTRSTASGSELWLRRWESLEARRLPGTEGQEVFFAPSPDGREVAFVSRTGPGRAPLRVLPVDGGPVRDLGTSAFGVTEWTDEGMVYFVGGPVRVGVSRVPATGGVAEAVTRVTDGEYFHALWSVLPGGEVGILEVRQRANQWADGTEIWAVDLETKERSLVVEGHSPRYANTGHLIFARADGTLMAAPFDESSMELAGPEVELTDGLFIEPVLGSVFYDVSDTGTLAYLTGTEVGGRYEFVWVDRAGQAIPVDEGETFEPGLASTFGWRLSPDDEQIAFQRFFQGNLDIWIKELPDGPMSPLTFLPTEEFAPRWSPDGQVVTFRSRIPGGADMALDSAWLQSKRVDGSEAASPVFDESRYVNMGFWSPPDGEWLVVQAGFSEGAVGALRPGVDSLPEELVAEDRRPLTPAVSPDGRWLAYSAVSASGRREVWVQPFPDSEGVRWQVSTDGGIGPVWAHDGQELFYVNPRTRQLVAVEYETTPTFRRLRPTPLHTIPESVLVYSTAYFYDVSSDDERFLMARWVGLRDASTEVIIIQDFFAELTGLVQD